MAIPFDAMRRAVDAGHADTALIGVPVSLMREILNRLPVETIIATLTPASTTGSPA
jgi:hypothetical protein